jgi:hypothetical protein
MWAPAAVGRLQTARRPRYAPSVECARVLPARPTDRAPSSTVLAVMVIGQAFGGCPR